MWKALLELGILERYIRALVAAAEHGTLLSNGWMDFDMRELWDEFC